MSCGSTHYPGCACHEARWQERLAAAEARVRALEEALRDAEELIRIPADPARVLVAVRAVISGVASPVWDRAAAPSQAHLDEVDEVRR